MSGVEAFLMFDDSMGSVEALSASDLAVIQRALTEWASVEQTNPELRATLERLADVFGPKL